MKRIYALTAAALFLCLYAVSCGRAPAEFAAYDTADYEARTISSQAALGWGGSGYNGNLAAEKSAPGAEDVSGNPLAVPERKLVKRADIRCRVQDLEEAGVSLMEEVDRYGAYVSLSRIYENSRSYSIRVPSSSYEAFLEALSSMGRPLFRSESAEDVSLRYYDLESRLTTKQELMETFRSYLRKAESIEDILSVEQRIAELQQEIEWMGTELKKLADLADYATVELELLGPASASSYAEPTLGERITRLFKSFGGYASSALVIIVGILIYGIPALLILTLLFWLLFGKVGLMKKLWRLASGKKKE
ncbi:DUF4349 domain-containing protein [Treponema sp. OttesenSCG-928-L16]|nr:DUF4349 domain-containing protein [Treponema sp. OttesenSCG-928-L16]